jgi:hypothetical protein
VNGEEWLSRVRLDGQCISIQAWKACLLLVVIGRLHNIAVTNVGIENIQRCYAPKSRMRLAQGTIALFALDGERELEYGPADMSLFGWMVKGLTQLTSTA